MTEETPKLQLSEFKYQRKCKDWLDSWMQWTLPRSEAKEQLIFWTGLFVLASGLRRHVKIPREYFGSWEASPNLYILFIAPAGRARKSTTANYSEELLEDLQDVTKSPELITKESLLTSLVKSEDGAMSIIAPEFGEFMVKSGPDMYGFLTNMYDGKRKITASTIGRGVEFKERPCFNLIGATTPEWVAENMPASVIGGGFASRVIMIREDNVRRRKLYYKDVDFKPLDEIKADLFDDLKHISHNLHGDFSITPEAMEFMEEWYVRTADRIVSPKLSGFIERLPAHAHKVAMLLHISYSDELVLTLDDCRRAVEIMEAAEERLEEVFEAVGGNPHTLDAYRIVDYVEKRGRVKRGELMREFLDAAPARELKDMIDGLLAAEYLVMRVEGMNTWFEIPSSSQMIPKMNGTHLTSTSDDSGSGSGTQVSTSEMEELLRSK